MLLRIFSDSKFSTAFLIFVFVSVLWIPSFLSPETTAFYHPTEPMPFYKWVAGLLSGQVLLSKIIAFLLVVLQAVLLVRLNARFILIQKRTFLPAFFFILLVSFYFPHLQFSPYLFGSIAMLLVINLIFYTYDRDILSWRFFEAGLLVGIGTLFYSRMIYFLPFIWVSHIILRSPSWREWLYPVLGLMVPAIYLVAVHFLTGNDPWGSWEVLYNNLNNFHFSFRFTLAHLAIAFYILLLVIIASGYMLRVYQFRKIYIRNYFLVFFWLFLISATLFTFLTRFDPGILYIAAIPVSFLLSNYFINARKSRINQILFGLILVLFLGNGLNHWFGWIS